MPLDSNSDVSDIESATDAEGNQVPVANDGTYSSVVEDEPIDSTGTLVVLDTRGKTILDLSISATSATDYVLEAGPDGETWLGPFDEWDSTDSINEAYRVGARFVRIRVSTAAQGGATATGYMEVS